MEETNVQRNYKDTVFRMIFKEKENLLSLYNALNGTDFQPEQRILRLSDAYEKRREQLALELIVTVYNINLGHNAELLEAIAMSIFEYDEEKHMKSEHEEGRVEGENRVIQLMQKLMDDRRDEDMKRVLSDQKYRERLYREYDL